MQATASALLLGAMLNQRFGYSAGMHDHLVLSPLGMQWADPDVFKNDWTIANVPQPHWFFDVVTYFGAAIDRLAAVYLVYFAAAMFAFGVATTLLARHWAPRHTWQAVLAVTAVGATVPLYLWGSGGIFWAVALPNTFGGFLLYLVVASVLVGRNGLAAISSVIVSMVHVQHGTIAFVLLVMMLLATWLRFHRVDRWFMTGAIASFAVVLGALKLRPVAGNIKDFAEICNQVIPYHCNATSWRSGLILAGLAMIMLALLTYFYVPTAERYRFIIVLLIPASALCAGLTVDLFNVPVLGVLAQGLNIYRLAVIFVPFIAWGIMLPVLADLGVRMRWIMLGAVSCMWYVALRFESWGLIWPTETPKNSHWLLAMGMALVAGCVALTVPGIVDRPWRLVKLALVAVVVASLTSAITGVRTASLRTFEPGFFASEAPLRQWGDAVQVAVPAGSQLLLPPTFVEARMATQRAVVVDCKYGPYGGPAWKEYESRLEDLGGIKQCRDTDVGYRRLSTDQLEAAARKYGAAYVGLMPNQSWEAYELRKRGWTLIVHQVATKTPRADSDAPTSPNTTIVGVDLWKAPWA